MIRLAIRVARGDAELVLAELLELAPSGVEEIELPVLEDGEPLVEYAVYGASGELPRLPDLRAAVGGSLVDISTQVLADDWLERWKQFHRPVKIELSEECGDDAITSACGRPALYVRPPWASPSAQTGAIDLVIDPAQAFGTGAHATTRLCLELLLELSFTDRSRGEVIDVGTGSGVLSIAAAKLGHGPVHALDNDPASVTAANDNAVANEVGITVRRFDLRSDQLPGTQSTPPWLYLANLLRPLLYLLSSRLACAPEHLLAGGLLRGEADEIALEFAISHGLRERRRLERGDWAALWLSRV